MTVQITLQDSDSVKELAVMMAAIEGSNQLDDVQSTVVGGVLTSCYEQDPTLDPSVIEGEAEQLKRKLYTGWV